MVVSEEAGSYKKIKMKTLTWTNSGERGGGSIGRNLTENCFYISA